MSYRLEPLPMTLSDLQGHLRFASLFVQSCNSWQDFNSDGWDSRSVSTCIWHPR